MTYAEFLETPFWKRLTNEKKKLVPRCEICGLRRGLQSHHHRYPSNWFETTLDDLIVLCRGCHQKQHGITRRGMWDEDVDIENFFHYVTIFINGVCSGQKYLCKREKKIFSRALRKWPERRIQFKVKHAIGFATRLFEEHSKR